MSNASLNNQLARTEKFLEILKETPGESKELIYKLEDLIWAIEPEASSKTSTNKSFLIPGQLIADLRGKIREKEFKLDELKQVINTLKDDKDLSFEEFQIIQTLIAETEKIIYQLNQEIING